MVNTCTWHRLNTRENVKKLMINFDCYNCVAKAVHSLATIRIDKCLSCVTGHGSRVTFPCVSCPPPPAYRNISVDRPICISTDYGLQFVPLICFFFRTPPVKLGGRPKIYYAVYGGICCCTNDSRNMFQISCCSIPGILFPVSASSLRLCH